MGNGIGPKKKKKIDKNPTNWQTHAMLLKCITTKTSSDSMLLENVVRRLVHLCRKIEKVSNDENTRNGKRSAIKQARNFIIWTHTTALDVKIVCYHHFSFVPTDDYLITWLSFVQRIQKQHNTTQHYLRKSERTFKTKLKSYFLLRFESIPSSSRFCFSFTLIFVALIFLWVFVKLKFSSTSPIWLDSLLELACFTAYKLEKHFFRLNTYSELSNPSMRANSWQKTKKCNKF